MLVYSLDGAGEWPMRFVRKLRKRKLWYAWWQDGTIKLSQFPADMPYRPILEEFDNQRQLDLYVATKRLDIHWERQPWTVSYPVPDATQTRHRKNVIISTANLGSHRCFGCSRQTRAAFSCRNGCNIISLYFNGWH
jgi:hypothetical protein